MSESTTDPRGYLNVAPALAEFASDKGVAAALAEGDGRKLHRALNRLREKARKPSERQALDALLRMRRLFMYPSGTPSLYTLNTLGVSLFGKSDPDPSDGTYIATHCVTALFLPLFPLSQWLVRAGEDNAYQIFGRIPNSPTVQFWRRCVVGAISAAFLFTWAANDWAGRNQDVHFANGLEVPVAVEAKLLGSEADASERTTVELQVSPGQHVAQSLVVGDYEIVVRKPDGQELQREKIKVPSRSDAVIFNVLGAAPLYEETVVYTTSLTGGSDGDFMPLAGPSFVVRPNVDYVFQDPPSSLKMSKSSSRSTRTHVDMAQGGWKVTVGMLFAKSEAEKASALVRTLLLATPELEGAQQLMHMAGAHDPGGVVGLGKALVERWPESIAAHRLYQFAHESTGGVQALRQEYRAQLESHPDSAMWGYLLARIETPARSRELLESLVGKFPDDKHIRRGLAWTLFNGGKARESLPHIEAYERLDPAERDSTFSLHARALLAVGRGEEALALAAPGDNSGVESSLAQAFLGVLIARRAQSAEKLALHAARFEGATPETGERMALWRTLLGLEVDDATLEKLEAEEAKKAVYLTRAALRDPAKSLEEVRTASGGALAMLHPPVAALLALESLRLGDTESAERLFEGQPSLVVYRPALEAYALRGDASELASLDPELQAAAHIIRARAHPRRSQQRRALLAKAQEADILQGPLTLALTQWEAATP